MKNLLSQRKRYVLAASVLLTGASHAAPNNPPSFTPGYSPTSTACEDVQIGNWAQDVTDGDGWNSRVDFRMVGISNADIYQQFPFVSWPSLTLTYKFKPGTPAGITSTVTAVLIDSSGTGQGGSDTSEPQTWTITTAACTDVDLDGIADEIDPFIDVDTDGDGIFDSVDMDDDNDGLPDSEEGDGILDTDGDGIPDSLDIDSDNDGLMDVAENGAAELDANGDGMIDGDVDADGNPLNSMETIVDSDGDGIPDAQEPNGDDVLTDTDGDGIPDNVDTDDDGDGIPDIDEGDGNIDSNGDGIPDSLDPESNSNGDINDTEVTVQSDSGEMMFVETGLSGGGCTLGSGFDPLLLMSGLFAGFGLQRRKLFSLQRKDQGHKNESATNYGNFL